MDTRSARLVILGGCLLTFGAAFANAALVLETGTSISHLTGDLAKLSMGGIQYQFSFTRELAFVSSAAASFLAGAFTSGFWIEHPTLDLRRPYGEVIAGIGALFLISSLVIGHVPILALCLAGYSCGLQNALATRFRGMVLRTTHVTGLVTDFGIQLGMKARGHRVAWWKVLVPGAMIVSFILGGGAATGAKFIFKLDPLFLVGAAYIGVGLTWKFRFRQNPPVSG